MPLSRLDLERGVYLFIATAYLSGLRETEAMRSRLQPPRTATCLLATFAVAAIDVEVDKVLAAFAWRAAIAALEGLAAQCETPAAPERVLAVADELSLNVWCRELMGIELGPRRPAISQGSRLAAADRAETEALQKGRRSVRELVDSHLVGENGLGGFQLVAHSLALAGKRIEDLQNELARGWLPAARLDSPVQQPAEQRTVAALTQAPPPPRLGRMLPLGVLLGTVVGIAVTGSAGQLGTLVLRRLVRDPAVRPSNWRSRRSLESELDRQGVVGISDLDTRALTRHLRERVAACIAAHVEVLGEVFARPRRNDWSWMPTHILHIDGLLRLRKAASHEQFAAALRAHKRLGELLVES